MTEQNKEAVTIPKKYIIIGVIILAVIAVGVVSYLIGSQKLPITGEITGTGQKQSCPFECCINDPNYESRVCQGSNYQCINNKCVKTNCPYECCFEGEYSAKLCEADYECKNNKCVPLDSDKDGLTDIEEKQLGTNPNLYDSDGDTLNDYQEVKVSGTNPLKLNTDDDRYNDNADPDPKTKNSASISVLVSNKDFGIDWISIGLVFIGGGVINPDTVIAKPKVTINVVNAGNDYSSFLSYDVLFIIANTEAKKFTVQKNRIEKNAQFTDVQNYEIKARDIPSILINVITKQSTQWDVQIQNINYEKF